MFFLMSAFGAFHSSLFLSSLHPFILFEYCVSLANSFHLPYLSLFLFPVLNSIFIFLVSSTSHFIVIIFIVFVCLDYFIKDFTASKTWFVSCCCWWFCCYLFCTDNSYIHFSGDFKDSSPVVIRTCHLTASAWIAIFVHFILPTALFPWPRTFIPQQFATVRCFFPSSLSLSFSFSFSILQHQHLLLLLFSLESY